MKDYSYEDMMVLEGMDDDANEQDYYLSMQRQVNAGMWSLQGSHGRAMMDAIKSGYVMLGKNSARDYYGNRIPSRDEVQEGSFGSRAFVVEHMGEDWARAMEDA